MKRVLVVLAMLMIVLLGGAGYGLLFTPLPLQLVASYLKDRGVEVAELEGSLWSGFGAKTVLLENSHGTFTISNIRFRYSNLAEVRATRRLVIEEINIDRMKVLLKKGETAQAEVTKSADKPASASGSKNLFANGKLEAFVVKKVNIANVEARGGGLPQPVKLDQFRIDDLVFQEKATMLGSFVIKSSFLDLELAGMTADEKGLKFQKDITGILKPTLAKILKKELGFSLKVDKTAEVWSGELLSFEGKVRFKLAADQAMSVETSPVDPADYFDVTMPLTQLVLTASAPALPASVVQPSGPMALVLQAAAMRPTAGTFKFGAADFKIQVADAPSVADRAPASVGTSPSPTAVKPAGALVPVPPGALLTGVFEQEGIRYWIHFRPTFFGGANGIAGNAPAGAPPTPAAAPGTAPGAAPSVAAPAATPMLVIGWSKTPIAAPAEILSMLHFRRPKERLNAEEKSRVEKDATFFAPL